MMPPFDIAQGFIEICMQDRSVDVLGSAFTRAVQSLGFKHFACCSHVDPLHPPAGAVVLFDYPQEWVQLYSERHLDLVDPVFAYADHEARPFLWTDPAFLNSLSPEQEALLQDAGSIGLKQGYTIPIHAPYSLPASCTLIPDGTRIDRMSFWAVHIMASYFHDVARGTLGQKKRLTLSPRERQCLELAAQGKSDWVIGRILGIGERTVHKHIESAKRRFGVSSRAQAVVQALFHYSISYGDILQTRTHPDERRH